MSSIKGDVKKKIPPPTRGQIVSRDPAHFSVACLSILGEILLWLVCHSCEVHLSVVTLRQSSREAGQAKLVFECRPWFYPRLAAYRYFRLSEGAQREISEPVPEHTGPISLTDTSLEPSVSRTN
jgi:hypothetical protein